MGYPKDTGHILVCASFVIGRNVIMTAISAGSEQRNLMSGAKDQNL